MRGLRKARQLLRRFWPKIRPQRALLAGSTVAIIFEAAMRLLEPWPLKFVIDGVLAAPPHSSGIGFLDAMSPGTLLLVSALAVAVIAGLRAGASYLATIGMAIAGNRVLTDIRDDLFRHIQRLSLRYHAKARTGDMITRLTGDVGRLQEVSVTAALPLFANTLTLIGMVGVMLWLNWQLALVALAVFPLFSPGLVRRGGLIHTVSRKQRRAEGELAASAAETLGGIKIVQALSLESRLERVFASQNEASLKEGVQARRLAAGLERRVDLLVGIGAALVLWFGALQVRRGEITVGELLVFMLYVKTAMKPMRDLAKYTGRIARAAASGERIVELLDAEPEIYDEPGAVAVTRLRGAVHFDRVSFAYEPGGTPALTDIELEVEAGTRVAVTGPSGAGKSTLSALLLRLYEPQQGAVRIDGVDVRAYTLASLRGQIATVLQESLLFGISIRDNIAFGLDGAGDEQVERAARLANAHGFISELPEGYETVIGERGSTLSGGQRQRLAIARAALRDAPIMLLDEPMTGLDEIAQRLVGEALHTVTEGKTTFVVAHDLAVGEQCDLVVFLERGRIVEQGSHAELVAANGPYARTLALQRAQRRLDAGQLVEDTGNGRNGHREAPIAMGPAR